MNTVNNTIDTNLLDEKTKELIKDILSFPYWYHKIELNGVITPGWAPLNPNKYGIPLDLTGKRVLDIGAWDGYWTFEALKRGAKEVVAVDNFSDYLGSLKHADRKAWATFDFCKKTLGYTDEQCKRYDMDVIKVDELGEFDIIFFFGTFYHLRHPFYVLEKLSKMCKDELYIESAICDDRAVYTKSGYKDKLIMEFYPSNEYGGNVSNWFVPTLRCLCHMTQVCGFDDVNGWKYMDNPTTAPECRGFVKAKKSKT